MVGTGDTRTVRTPGMGDRCTQVTTTSPSIASARTSSAVSGGPTKPWSPTARSTALWKPASSGA